MAPSTLPARMLNEFVYCPRLFYLEWVQGEFAENSDVEQGRLVHRRVAEEQGALEAPAPDSPGSGGDEGPTFHARSVWMTSERLGLTARADLVEAEGASATPVEYKKGRAPDTESGAWEPDEVQLCVQALLLREEGFTCTQGVIYYAGSRKRVVVPISEELVAKTLAARDAARAVATGGRIPAPLVDSPKCPRCSLVSICLPDEVGALSNGASRAALDPRETRRMFPSRDDAFPVHVTGQGARVGKKGDLLEIRPLEGVAKTVRLMEVSQLCLHGNVSVTTQALRALADRSVPVCYFTHGGWFVAITHGMTHKNVELRLHQYRASQDADVALTFAKRFVEGKVRNGRTLLRRNTKGEAKAPLAELARLLGPIGRTDRMDALLGLEGAAARVYFAHFDQMLRPRGEDAVAFQFDFEGRNRRPPKDPVNALLSFLYAMLVKDLTVLLTAVGFDPYLGLYHQPKYGRPALALDLMEEFRPLIADSTVLTLLNTGEIGATDFVRRGVAVGLREPARRKVLQAYERRLDTEVQHPLFGYALSYRRVMQVQARLLGRALAGEIAEYPPFCTR